MALTGTDLFLVNRGGNDYNVSHTDLVASFQNTFSGATAPPNPQAGWIWYDTDTKHLNVYNGSDWDVVSGVTVADAAPAGQSVNGDLWYDTNDGRLYIYADDGSSTQWVDASPDNVPDLSTVVLKAGDTMTGALNVPDLKVTNDATVEGLLLTSMVPKSMTYVSFPDNNLTSHNPPQTVGIPFVSMGLPLPADPNRRFIDCTLRDPLLNRKILVTINEGGTGRTGPNTQVCVVNTTGADAGGALIAPADQFFRIQVDNLLDKSSIPGLCIWIWGDIP